MLEPKRLGNDGTGTARSEPASQGSDEMDKKDDPIAHHRILAGREIPTNYGRNNNSPATGKKLKINYRTTDEIRRFSVRLLEARAFDDLDGGEDDQKGYMSLTHGMIPEVKVFTYAGDEVSYLKQYIGSLTSDGTPLESICLVARTKKLVDIYAEHLRSAGSDVYEIKRDAAEQRDRPGIRVATMHRVKGLEFEHVIVAGA